MLLWWASFDIWQLTIDNWQVQVGSVLSSLPHSQGSKVILQIIPIHTHHSNILYCVQLIKIIVIIKIILQICSGVRGAAKGCRTSQDVVCQMYTFDTYSPMLWMWLVLDGARLLALLLISRMKYFNWIVLIWRDLGKHYSTLLCSNFKPTVWQAYL